MGHNRTRSQNLGTPPVKSCIPFPLVISILLVLSLVEVYTFFLYIYISRFRSVCNNHLKKKIFSISAVAV